MNFCLCVFPVRGVALPRSNALDGWRDGLRGRSRQIAVRRVLAYLLRRNAPSIGRLNLTFSAAC
jgi:hypothetical protein